MGSKIEPNQSMMSSHSMSIQSEGVFMGPNYSKVSMLQEETRRSFEEMSISGQPKSVFKSTLTTSILAEDPDGFKVPASKNLKVISVKNGNSTITPVPQLKTSSNLVPENQVPIKNPLTNTSSQMNSEQPVNPKLIAELIKKEEKKDDDNEIKLEDLKKVELLGSGSQGHVEKMIHIPTGNIIALKVNFTK